MKITLVMVMSLDGKTTSSAGPIWSSAEDREQFESLKKIYPVLIMGRKTYDVVTKHQKISSPPIRIVVSRTRGVSQPGMLEFTTKEPKELVADLEKRGFTSALLVGGSKLAGSFLHQKLITDCYITIEPTIFGQGNPLFVIDAVSVRLKLDQIKKLNETGSIRLHYIFHYDS